MNILLVLAFNGARYHGFQVQKNAVSVCMVLQDAMEAVFGGRPDVKGCSRTDAGVHARAFCLNFKWETGIPPAKLPLALNQHLPADIRVKSARLVPKDFHARYSATGKEYEYRILNAPVDDPLQPGLYYRITYPLNVERMRLAGRYLVGKHDFSAFMSAGSSVEDTVRTVHRLEVEREGDWVSIRVAADGFLYNMVRIIAGTLARAGSGKMPPEEVAGALVGKDRRAAGETLPAQGLFLDKVFYPEEALYASAADDENSIGARP